MELIDVHLPIWYAEHVVDKYGGLVLESIASQPGSKAVPTFSTAHFVEEHINSFPDDIKDNYYPESLNSLPEIRVFLSECLGREISYLILDPLPGKVRTFHPIEELLCPMI